MKNYPETNFPIQVSFEKKITGAFLLSLLIAITIFYSFYRTNEKIIDTSRWVVHTNNVLIKTEEVLTQVQDIETSARGFLLTNDTSFLGPYKIAAAAIYNTLALLKDSTSDNPRQQLFIDALQRLVTENIAIRKRQIALRMSKADLTTIAPLIYAARASTKKIRTVISQIEAEENALLVKRQKANAASIANFRNKLPLFIISYLAIIFIAFLTIYQNTRKKNKAEAALSKTEELIRAIIDHAPTLINVKDLSGGYLLVNKRFAGLFQSTPEQMAGKTLPDLLTAEPARQIQAQDNYILKTKKNSEMEIELPAPDGVHTYISSKFPIYDHNGAIYAIGSVATDITSSKKVHEQLKEKHAQLQKILNGLQRLMATSLDVICLIDGAGKFVQVSETCKNLWGYEAKELVGRAYMDFVVEDDRDKTALTAADIMSGIPANGFENRYRRKDGTIVPVIWTAAWSEEDKIMYCIAHNGTEKKQTAQQLAQTQARLVKAQQIARLGNWEWDIQHNTLSCSDEVYHLLGIKPESTHDVKSILKNAIHPDDLPAIQQAFKTAVEKGVSLDIEHRLIRADERILYVHTRGEIILDEAQRPIWISGTILDITQRKKLELELKQLNNNLEKRAVELRASNAELERFAYVASHDMQEPLRMVSSFLTLLEKRLNDQLDDTAKKYIHFAIDGSERMKRLIQDLLQYSRIGKGDKDKAPVPLHEVVAAVLQMYAPTLEETGANVQMDELPVVIGNKTQLTQLFQNLVGNALKYRSEDTPLIKIGCKEENGEWLFSVSDNGIGIDPKFYAKVFVIFQRLHNKSEFSGTGIGLAICKKIIENHGGRIWVESTPGKGSTFYFTIPKNR